MASSSLQEAWTPPCDYGIPSTGMVDFFTSYCSALTHIYDSQCLQLLQGHAALVCQLQLTDTTLATGGSDGRVIIFQLPPTASSFVPSEATYDNRCKRIAAHDSSVTSLQLDSHFLVTGGNDGLVRLYDANTGEYIRDLSTPAEQVWKVAHRYDKCVIMCKRAGKTVMEIWSLRPSEEDD